MEKGRFRFGLSMMGSYLHTEHGVDPDQFEPGVADEAQPRRHILDVGLVEWDLDAQLGVHRRFAFELFLPLRINVIDAAFEDESGAPLPDFRSIHHRDEVIGGPGDFVVGGRIGLVLPENVPRWNLDLRASLSLPTGNIEENPFELGERGEAHQHMFFGSGTVDPMLGLESQVAFDEWRLVTWTQAKIPAYANRHGYRASRLVVGGVGAQSGFGLKRFSFLLQPEVYFETPAVWGDEPARNSGRLSLIATAGAFAMPAERWQIHLLAKIPYYTWAKGGQLRWPFLAILGFSYTFDVGKKKPTPGS